MFRAICHCTICQAFNKAPCADILVYAARHVAKPASERIVFHRWRLPPNVQRGVCAQCGKPALELFRAPLFPKLAMLPTASVSVAAPAPAMHMFYDRRVADCADALPKYSGYWSSQWAFMKQVLSTRR